MGPCLVKYGWGSQGQGLDRSIWGFRSYYLEDLGFQLQSLSFYLGFRVIITRNQITLTREGYRPF